MASIESLLSVPNMIGTIQSVKSGIPRVLPDPFFTTTRPVISDFASYRKVTGTRRLPKTSQYGAPSRAASKQDVAEVPVKLIHSIENQQYGQLILQNLSGFNSTGNTMIPQKMAEDEVVRQTVEFKKKFENLRTASVNMAISKGKIYLASDGTFLPTSSGAAVTVDYGVPTSNVGTPTDILGSGNLSWDNAAADIIGQTIAFKTMAVQTSGYPLKYAFYGANVLKYMLSNTAAQALIVRSPQFNQSFLNNGMIPNGFQELTWIPVYSAFFEDDNGVRQTSFDPDSITFTPEITDDWYEMLEGSYVIIPSPGVMSGTAGQMLDRAVMSYGMFSYATRTNDPVGVKQVVGDTFLPVIKNGNVMFRVQVKF